MSLQVSSPGPTSLVPPGWYVVPELPGTHQHTLLAGEQVNPLDGWDIEKLGWFKVNKQNHKIHKREAQRIR